jgi:hypothetical protein
MAPDAPRARQKAKHEVVRKATGGIAMVFPADF